MRRPLAVAITGGIGAGKSAALDAFARRGAATLSADDIVHALLREPEVQARIEEALGVRLRTADAEERAALAEAVFGDPSRVEGLERILHPRVVAEQQRWRDEVARRPEPPSLCVIEVPLLYETGGDARFDAVVVITAPPQTRAARKLPASAAERERRLLPDDEKARRADFAYVNDGTLDELDAFVARVVDELEARR